MKRSFAWILGVAALVGLGAVVWFFATTGIDESTADVTAPTLAAAPTSPETTGSTAAESTATTTGVASDTTVAESDTSGPAGSEGGGTVFAIGEDSAVTFELDEVLNGNPARVVATNSEVEGQLRIDPSDLSTVEVGTIVIGAQTFESGSSNRDRAIRGPILDASSFPQITFVPTSVEGLDGEAEVGEAVSFTITGDLTIRDITEEVTFDVTATLESEVLVEAVASSTVSRDAFGLTIPSVASVANVSDEVAISIDLVANPV